MADSVTLCAVCSEVLSEAVNGTVDTNITDYALTECCYQPICQCCSDFITAQSETITEITDSFTNTFTCPNCRTATTIMLFNVNQALDSVLTNLQARHYSVMAVIKMHPKIIHFQEQKLAKSEQQLEANLIAVLSQASKLKATPSKVSAAVQAHRQAQYKNFQLLKVDYQRLRHQIDAGIKYLTRWQQQINQVAKSVQFKPIQDSQTLIKLDYALTRFQHKLEEVPRVPDYIPVRWFNDQLVLDDYQAQFKAVTDHKPVEIKTYPGLVRYLKRDFQLGDFIEAVILVEPNLTCYQCGRHGYALVDSTGKVIHYCYDRILAINSTWLVTLVGDIATQSNPAETYIQVQLLAEVIKTLTPSPCGPRIRIFPANYKRETPKVEIVPGNSDLGLSDQLIIWYERFDLERGQTSSIYSPGITTVQKWSIDYLGSGLQCEMTAELLAKQDLSSDQILSEYHCDNAVFWRDSGHEDHNDSKYYGCLGLYDGEWRDLGSGLEVLRPIEMSHYILLPDGSLLNEEDDQNGYYRPIDSGEVSVKVGPFSRDVFNQITTTGWDGRIVKVNTAAGEDEADVVMDFY